MFLLETLKLAVRTIRRNSLRSLLTVLGIVIGVGAVIAMVTIGRGVAAKVTADLGKLGSNLLFVRPGQFGPGRASSDAKPFNIRDIEALRTQLSGVRALAPTGQKGVTTIFGSESRNTTLTGTDNGYFQVVDWPMRSGRQFLDSEIRAGRGACILGETVRARLFQGEEAIGKDIRINKVTCEVIGVLTQKGQTSFGTDQDDIIIVPLRLLHRRIAGNTDIATILVSAEDGADTAKVQASIERLLRERRNIAAGREDDFTVRDMRQIIETQAASASILTGLLGAVASISLLVGGIGIMNIMLVSVTERTREIGIRLAIGALESQVLLQFLVEAVVLSLFGGLVGIALGLGLAALATDALGVPLALDPVVLAGSFAFSALVGVVFGFFPARRAARLDPIVALRTD